MKGILAWEGTNSRYFEFVNGKESIKRASALSKLVDSRNQYIPIFIPMALSPNEIRSRAIAFIHDHQDDKYEKGESQIFWRDFFNIWGISAKKVGIFEERAKTLKKTTGFIDYFWPKTILIEQKSRGEDLDKAYKQALDYCLTGGIQDDELPNYICVCDFERLRLVNFTDQTKSVEFKVSDLKDHLQHFNFLLGYEQREYKDEDPVNIKAAELMGKLHDELERNGFKDHPLKLMLVRLMFCFFADDTGIFNKDDFLFFLKERTKEDGSDLGLWIAQFFQILNTPNEQRPSNLDEDLSKFPYINGQLFEEGIPFAQFDKKLRDILIKACEFNWSVVSPAIFGSLFQSVMNKEERRELGAHYTSEKNILKTIHGLFLDELNEEFENAKKKKSVKGLQELLDRIRKIKILDPACGCGNFLILAYRELRRLEIRLLKEIRNLKGLGLELSIQSLNSLDVDCLYGIEIEEFPAQIAKTAIWIMDHLMNVESGKEFGEYYVRLPLKKSPAILIQNALRVKWQDIVSPDEITFIIGNPPFVGKKEQNEDQKKDTELLFKKFKGAGVLDYVSCWYLKAADYIQGKKVKVAFVSTNSICQGEQVGILWNILFNQFNLKIHFAHRTFNWRNEAKGNAAVHCVIIGFANFDVKSKRIFEYPDIDGTPIEIKVENINPYLVQGKDFIIESRRKPICNSPEIVYGSFALDDGNYTLSSEERDELLTLNKESEKFIRLFLGGRELLHSEKRYCLWLVQATAEDLSKNQLIKIRVEAVKKWRSASGRETTKKLSEIPMLFAEIRQPDSNYLAFPTVSSVNRRYIPIEFLNKEVIASNQLYVLPNANEYSFGILTSSMHMSWIKYVCGRMKSDFRYSAGIVYNNFPWPENPTEKQKEEIESLAKSVLDARAQFPESSLAELYDPLTMPKVLRDAHNKLDRAVDKLYRSKPFQSESERVEFLFELYEKYTNTLTSQIKTPPKKRRSKAK
ncbi:N-6 DNA methylase [Leptospira sp. 85282-16]|uniref:DNA methyltransferase n=1 Tax=Leptospira sp. 85282-16 TaxID=2971256 RepID=UPI0021BF7961|nr:DNA methyltransferase [Leptospira sp. 85282-16]MCT8335704.1 N-6 DNA methylase [Leptospira sp. 85282-16]